MSNLTLAPLPLRLHIKHNNAEVLINPLHIIKAYEANGGGTTIVTNEPMREVSRTGIEVRESLNEVGRQWRGLGREASK